MMRAGTLPGRKPGIRICEPIFLYAASRLGFSSSNGTSTESRTRVGLRFSAVLFTAVVLLVDRGSVGCWSAPSCSAEAH